jgi:mannose-1-phosphate guanylyltransferase / mannose-6-phosphate isomerase
MADNITLIPVILSGGSGTRLWPLSRKGYPKQFLPLVNDETLFTATVRRALSLPNTGRPLVLANEGHRFLVAEQMDALVGDEADILLEPCARNTAPAIAAAAHFILQKYNPDNTLMLVMPADHVIQDQSAFNEAVQSGAQAAQRGHLVTFGVVPTHAETGYGYIQASSQGVEGAMGVQNVARFVEKPDAPTAQSYLESGDYTWNSGMFLLRADSFLEQIQRHEPLAGQQAMAAVDMAMQDLDFIRLDAKAFGQAPSVSVDYGVMERTDKAAVASLDCGWSDVGSWSALWELAERDADGNATKGDVICKQTRNSLLLSDRRLLATLGVENLVIIDTPDAVLVAHKDRVQEVRSIVDELISQSRPEADLHREVHRPWGTFDCIDQGARFQVKRITVNPGSSLSSQKHFHRAEHWIVVRGTAEVECDGEVSLLTENQSAYIPLGSVHRLRNPGKVPLEIIEVQSGSYLGEDDIVRFDDHYGRSQSS